MNFLYHVRYFPLSDSFLHSHSLLELSDFVILPFINRLPTQSLVGFLLVLDSEGFRLFWPVGASTEGGPASLHLLHVTFLGHTRLLSPIRSSDCDSGTTILQLTFALLLSKILAYFIMYPFFEPYSLMLSANSLGEQSFFAMF